MDFDKLIEMLSRNLPLMTEEVIRATAKVELVNSIYLLFVSATAFFALLFLSFFMLKKIKEAKGPEEMFFVGGAISIIFTVVFFLAAACQTTKIFLLATDPQGYIIAKAANRILNQ